MAQIRVNEISQNYAYSVGTASFATVAIPITAAWGPGFVDPGTVGMSRDDVLERTSWTRFPATRQGLESFVATYRGPASNYRIVKDYSYYQAMTLLTAGYDVLVCRLCPGSQASNSLEIGHFATDASGEFTDEMLPDPNASSKITFTAKYPGTFGNNLIVRIQQVANRNYWNIITYVKDSLTGVTSAVENLTCYFDLNNPQDNILHVSELESEFIDIQVSGELDDTGMYFFYNWKPKHHGTITEATCDLSQQVTLKDGSDTCPPVVEREWYEDVLSIEWDSEAESGKLTTDDTGTLVRSERVCTSDVVLANEDEARITDILLSRVVDNVLARFNAVGAKDEAALSNDVVVAYLKRYGNVDEIAKDSGNIQDLSTAWYKEWLYRNVLDVYDLLKDKLTYNPNRIISPGWDDMDIASIDDSVSVTRFNYISPIHCKLMEVAYYSRCGCAYLDIPRCLPRSYVYNESVKVTASGGPGYAQMLSRVEQYALNWSVIGADRDLNAFLYPTHAALFAPWGQYSYAGLSKMCPASPAFLALMIERAMIKNQSTQYEWILPTVRRHKLNIGKLDYSVSKKLLDQWQKLEGVGVNVITNIPDMGVSIWGNSTLFETPPATYQALSNLSTRKLMNAVKDISYRCGLAITFQYNNDQAYAAFYAGVTPTLDNMKNAGAIEGYKISMAADINGLDRVNANTVIGVITLYCNGVINDINIDLIAMPAGAGLE